MRRRKSAHRATQSKETRKLIGAIEQAGGTVTITARGHLKVIGPGGLAIIGSAAPTGRHDRGNALSTLRNHAGINLAVS